MAGHTRTRERLFEAERERDELRARVSELESLVGQVAYEPGEPRKFNAKTRAALIRDMLEKADRGLSLEEIAAAWNVGTEDVRSWAEDDVSFRTAVGRARTRGRAAVLGSMRKLLESGRGIPAAFSDRMLALHDAAFVDEDGASDLIGLAVAMPSDSVSCPQCGLTFEPYDDRPTQSESDGQKKR